MKEYTYPEVEIQIFHVEDVITSSEGDVSGTTPED